MLEAEKRLIENKIETFFTENDIPVPESWDWTFVPFAGEWGISLPIFPIAAAEARRGKRVNVPARAQEIANATAEYLGAPEGFLRIEAERGFLNLYLVPEEFSRRVISTVLEQGEDFGRGDAKGKRVMVEFSQPNTHKALHVGHLRNMILGAAVANILEFAGYEVVRANYIGDFGRDVVKWIWNYQKRHAGEEPATDTTRWMGDMYAESTQMLETDPDGEAEIQAFFARWEANDPEALALWEKTRQWSLDGFNQIYEQMGIHFDRIYFESEMEKPGKAYVMDLLEREIAVDERPDNPVVIKLDELLGNKKDKFRVLPLLRSDGTSLYGAWDLALAQKKFEEYDLDQSIYIVDVRQSLHFTQVFKTLEIAGVDEIKKAVHLPYEIVNLPGNVVMSSRDGTVVLLEDLIRIAVGRALELNREKNPDLPDDVREEVARAVALGAIKYPMISRDNTKMATFDWEAALDFNGQAAPYIQYMHVRANSLLRRTDGPLPDVSAPQYEMEPAEVTLIDLLARTPDEIQRAAADYKTLHITNHAYKLAKAFSDFYNQCQVLSAPPEIRDTRLCLVAATKQALANLLNILGIAAPDVM
jgi:arginyl-tRNA synthetase